MLEQKSAKRLINIDRVALVPFYIQIYDRFREVIAEGLLKPGDRVPSLRSLSAELGVARGTIETAYEMLCGEGYFLAKGQAGTVIAPFLGKPASALPPSNKPQHLNSDSGTVKPLAPFQLGLPALDAFPRKLWSKLGCRRLKSTTLSDMRSPDPKGYMPLRQALAAYLLISRGISCKPTQIIITDGYKGSLDIISRGFLKENDSIWVEDPSYPVTRNLLRAVGGVIMPIPVDEEGMVISFGIKNASQASLAIVTPSHQSPLGVTLSLSRRLELLKWAADNQAWIVEDDYDGEYRYSSRPLPALKSLDHEDRVIYAGTFSKVLLPALRLAYIVVPESQVTHMDTICATFQSGCPWLTQATVTDFMLEGHFSRHIKKMRVLYSYRRNLLVEALTSAFGNQLSIELQAGGMHLLVRLAGEYDDKRLAKHLNDNGLAVHALSNWRIEQDCGQGLMLGFTNIHSSQLAEALVDKLKALLMI